MVDQLGTQRSKREAAIQLALRAAAEVPLEVIRLCALAADGSMVPGDIVVAINGKPVDSVAGLLARLDDHQVGDAVRLSILPDSRKVDVTVTLVGGVQ
jgi:S1-C subfamily serine protease